VDLRDVIARQLDLQDVGASQLGLRDVTARQLDLQDVGAPQMDLRDVTIKTCRSKHFVFYIFKNKILSLSDRLKSLNSVVHFIYFT
jgi:hypothetical protein